MIDYLFRYNSQDDAKAVLGRSGADDDGIARTIMPGWPVKLVTGRAVYDDDGRETSPETVLPGYFHIISVPQPDDTLQSTQGYVAMGNRERLLEILLPQDEVARVIQPEPEPAGSQYFKRDQGA